MSIEFVLGYLFFDPFEASVSFLYPLKKNSGFLINFQGVYRKRALV